MIFSQADRMNLQAVKTLLVQHVHETGGDDEIVRLLNELGVAVGRIEHAHTEILNRFAQLAHQMGGSLLQFEDIKKALNRRADELLDTVRGRNDITNNAIVALSGRLTQIQEQYTATDARLGALERSIAALDRRFTQEFHDRTGAMERKLDAIDAMFKNAVFAVMKRQRKARRKKK